MKEISYQEKAILLTSDYKKIAYLCSKYGDTEQQARHVHAATVFSGNRREANRPSPTRRLKRHYSPGTKRYALQRPHSQ